MGVNFIKTAFRNLSKHKLLAFINIAGLSVGIASFMLIFLWVNYELSFDRFNKNAKDVYRVYSNISMNGNNFTSSMAPPPLADLLVKQFPEVIASTRIWKYNSQAVSIEEEGGTDKVFNEEVYQADSTFFKIFNFKMLQGNPNTALTVPFSVVITKETAIKYFGESTYKQGAVLGKSLAVTFGGYKAVSKITGITEDVPSNAHFHYRIIMANVWDPWSRSQVWVDNTYYTYVLLKKGTDPKAIEAKIPSIIRKYLDPQLRSNFGTSYDELKSKSNYWEYKLQPLTDLHLRSDFERELEPNGNINSIYILSVVALFLILMACINYANLATANSIQRSKEIGIRKTLGSSKLKLRILIFTESGIITLLSWLVALLLIFLCIHPFENLMRTHFPGEVFKSGLNWAVLIAIFLVVTFLGGVYPAFYLSSFDVIKAIKGNVTPGKKFIGFKNVLLVTQFVIFIGLVISAILVYKQLNYLKEKSPGFNKENIIVIKDPSILLGEKSKAFIDQLKQQPKVVSACISLDYPGSGNDNFPIAANSRNENSSHILTNFSAGYDFLKTFDIKLVAGRDFSRDIDREDTKRVILNEAAVREMALQKPVNNFIITQYLNALNIEQVKYEVIGVAKDFNFQSLHKTIRPIAIFLNTQGTYICIRIKPGGIDNTLARIKNIWQSFLPGRPFEYHFVDDKINSLYKTELSLSRLLTILTALIIFIAGIGLTGLTLLTIQQRTKEIGMRKVLGASLSDILYLLSKEYIKWIIVSFLIASPLAYITMNAWLQNFAYRIEIQGWIFAMTGILAILIALLTISFQTIKAGMVNPVKSLRSE